MRATLLPFLLLPALLLSAPADEAWPASPTNGLDIYLCLGQSNMAGRGVLVEDEIVPSDRVWKFTRWERWLTATDPVQFDRGRDTGVGPSKMFGRVMADADPAARIGLVPGALGGTEIFRWTPSGDLFSNAVKRAQKALAAGTLRGIIWHQGENDSNDADAPHYAERLEQVVKGFREALGAPDLPFVAGELGDFLERRPTLKDNFQSINAQIRATMERLPHCAWVGANDLDCNGDNLHFDADSARDMGYRMARAMLRLQGRDDAGFQALAPTEILARAEGGPAFRAEGGLLVATAPTNRIPAVLRSRRDIGDVVLRFDFRPGPAARAALVLRADGNATGDVLRAGIAIPLLDDRHRVRGLRLARHGYTGAIRGVAPSRFYKNTTSFIKDAGEWNTVEIFLCGSRAMVVINDCIVLRQDLDRMVTQPVDPDGNDHPELTRKTGLIELVALEGEIALRNIFAKEM